MNANNAYSRMLKYREQVNKLPHSKRKTSNPKDFEKAFAGLKRYSKQDLQKEYAIIKRGEYD